MSTPVICLVDAPQDPAQPGAVLEVLRRDVAMTTPVWLDLLGHDDFSERPAALLNHLCHQTFVRKRRLVALSGRVQGLAESPEGLPLVAPGTDLGDARVVASTPLFNSRQENALLINELELAVAPDHRRQGLGTAMIAAVEQVARSWGVTTLNGYSEHPGEPVLAEDAGQDVIRPAEGPFGVPADDPAARFCLSQGFELVQTERHSVQPFPSDPGEYGTPEVPDGYELLTWSGPIDAALAEQVADLSTVFEATIPMGDLAQQPEVYTAERILAGDATQHKDNDTVTAAVRDVASGRLVGRSQLVKTLEKIEPAWQGVTIVVPEHRGHGLGRTLKLAAIHEAHRRWPGVKRVHTWNAGENDHMWAINHSLGYQTAGIAGAWQKKL